MFGREGEREKKERGRDRVKRNKERQVGTGPGVTVIGNTGRNIFPIILTFNILLSTIFHDPERNYADTVLK